MDNRNCKNFQEENLKVLFEILKDNSNTEIGKLYNFSSINNYEQYKNSVKFSEYNDYEEYLNRMIKGEKNILTSHNILSYLSTSGTTSIPKKIPITERAMEKYCYDYDINKENIIREYRKKHGVGKRLLAHIFPLDINKDLDQCFIISELGYFYMYKKGKLIEEEHVGGFDLLFDPETKDINYVKLWASFLEENIALIETIFFSKFILFLNYFKTNYKEIISDILNNRIPADKLISVKIRNKLLSMPINKNRLNYIMKECDKGFDNIIKRIWPHVQIISGISAKTSLHEKKNLDYYCGDIPRDYFCYCSSEAYIGYPIIPNKFEYAFYPKGNFFEIISYKDNNENRLEEKVYQLSEAKPGYQYELVITTFSGFYRYRTKDIITIKQLNENMITFEFEYRLNLGLNVIGEKVDIQLLEKVINKLKEIIPNLIQYAFGANYNGSQVIYYLFLGLDEINKEINKNDIAQIMDETLCENNPMFKMERKANKIGIPKVFIFSLEDYVKIINISGKNERSNKTISIIPINGIDEIMKKIL